ncbi:hypothetical protein [Glutamicibacter arilaitensis]
MTLKLALSVLRQCQFLYPKLFRLDPASGKHPGTHRDIDPQLDWIKYG